LLSHDFGLAFFLLAFVFFSIFFCVALIASKYAFSTGHFTNKTLDRYVIEDQKQLKTLYAEMRPGKKLVRDLAPLGKSQVADIKR